MLVAVLIMIKATYGRVSTFEEQRRIPWAPRVIAREEVAVLANVDAGCRVEALIAFKVLNFKLQQDGDVLYRYEDGSLLQEGQLGRGSILCSVDEGHTENGKPVFDCSLSIAWRADLLLTPVLHDVTAEERVGGARTGLDMEPVLESVLSEMPSGIARLGAKLVVSKVPRLVAQAAWASTIGERGPPSAVLTETAKFVQCRGPLSDAECAEDRWEISLDAALPGEEGEGGGGGSGHQQGLGGPWIAIDIGSTSSVVGLLLDWGVDYAHAYDVQVSLDSLAWTTVWSEVNAPAARNDASSMHTVHFIDLRKAGPPQGQVGGGGGGGGGVGRLYGAMVSRLAMFAC